MSANNQTPGRFWLFAGMDYYPSGGFDDWLGCFASEDEARAAISSGTDDSYGIRGAPDWAHIVDAESLKIVWVS